MPTWITNGILLGAATVAVAATVLALGIGGMAVLIGLARIGASAYCAIVGG